MVGMDVAARVIRLVGFGLVGLALVGLALVGFNLVAAGRFLVGRFLVGRSFRMGLLLVGRERVASTRAAEERWKLPPSLLFRAMRRALDGNSTKLSRHCDTRRHCSPPLYTIKHRSSVLLVC